MAAGSQWLRAVAKQFSHGAFTVVYALSLLRQNGSRMQSLLWTPVSCWRQVKTLLRIYTGGHAPDCMNGAVAAIGHFLMAVAERCNCSESTVDVFLLHQRNSWVKHRLCPAAFSWDEYPSDALWLVH